MLATLGICHVDLKCTETENCYVKFDELLLQQFEADLRAYLDKRYKNPEWPIMTSVSEVKQEVRIRGKFMEEIADFLTERGM